MLATRGLFALIYSPPEKDYWITDLEVALKYNIGSFARGEIENGYTILAISESRPELREFWKSFTKSKEAMGV